MKNIIISTTAKQTGFGTAQHKRVTGLTKTEREAVRSGSALVVYRCGCLSGGSYGTAWRMAVKGTRRDFYPRVPSDEVIAAAEAL